jgi:hypothetical protein
MASAVAIGGIIGIPVAVSNAIESFDALQTKIMQNMELANQYDGNTQKLHTDMNRMGEATKIMAQGFGVSLNEVQEGMQIITRRFKDADTAMYLHCHLFILCVNPSSRHAANKCLLAAISCAHLHVGHAWHVLGTYHLIDDNQVS